MDDSVTATSVPSDASLVTNHRRLPGWSFWASWVAASATGLGFGAFLGMCVAWVVVGVETTGSEWTPTFFSLEYLRDIGENRGSVIPTQRGLRTRRRIHPLGHGGSVRRDHAVACATKAPLLGPLVGAAYPCVVRSCWPDRFRRVQGRWWGNASCVSCQGVRPCGNSLRRSSWHSTGLAPEPLLSQG